MLANGKLTADHFLLAAHESDFFINNMNINGINNLPILDSEGDLKVSNVSNLITRYVGEQFGINRDLHLKMRYFVTSIGSEKLLKYFSKLEEYLLEKGQIDHSNPQIKGKSLVQVWRKFMETLNKARNVYLETGDRYILKVFDTYEKVINSFYGLMKVIHHQDEMIPYFNPKDNLEDLNEYQRVKLKSLTHLISKANK